MKASLSFGTAEIMKKWPLFAIVCILVIAGFIFTPLIAGTSTHATLSATSSDQGIVVTLYGVGVTDSITIRLVDENNETYILPAKQIENTLWQAVFPLVPKMAVFTAYEGVDEIASLTIGFGGVIVPTVDDITQHEQITETLSETIQTPIKKGKALVKADVSVTDATLKKLQVLVNVHKHINENGTVNETVYEGIPYKVDVEFEKDQSPIRSIKFKELKLQETLDLRVHEVTNKGKYAALFSIDPSALDFTEATVTVTAKGTTLYKCVDWDFASQTCTGEWVLYKKNLIPGKEYSFIITPDDPGFAEVLDIINMQSYPDVNGEWRVKFNTYTTANLTITVTEGTSWQNGGNNEDLEFLTLMCGENEIPYVWINNSVFVENYECNTTSTEISKVLTVGEHHLQFTFGNLTKYANNMAGEEGYKVQSGVATITSTVQNITLDTPIAELNRAFVMRPHYYSASSDTAPPTSNNAISVTDSQASVYLSSLDTITVRRGASAENIYLDYIVVEALNEEFNVTRGYFNWVQASGLTIDIKIGTTVNSAYTYAYAYTDTTGTSLENFDTVLFRAYMLNSTHLRIQRDVADAGVTGRLRWVVVEFDPTKIDSIETGTTTVTTQTESAPRQVTLTTPVDVNQSLLLFAIGVADSGLDQVGIAGRLVDSSTIEFYKYATTTNRNIRYYVIDFGNKVGAKHNGTIIETSTTVYDIVSGISPDINVSHSLFFTSATSDGTGTAFTRTFWTVDLQSNYLHHYRSRSGQPHHNEWQVLELPYIPPDTVNPSVNTLVTTPTLKKLGRALEINATVTDDRAVSSVKASITLSNGTVRNLTMTDNNADSIYNATLLDTVFTGLYQYTIVATDSANNVNDSVQSNFTVVYDDLSVLTNKQSYLAGENVSIVITGFDANVLVSINVFDGTLDPVNASYPKNILTNATGGLSTLWFIPPAQALGTYGISATHTGTGRSTTSYVNVVLAIITANSSSYQVGQIVGYSGSNWDAFEDITVNIQDSSATIVYGPFNETANISGEFSNTWTVPWDELYGNHTLYGEQFNNNYKNNTMIFDVIPRQIVFATDRAFYHRDQTVSISGQNYRPSSTVTVDITYLGSSVSGYPKNKTITAGGLLSDSWIVPSAQTVGEYSISSYDFTYRNLNASNSLNISLQNVSSERDAYNIDDVVSIRGYSWTPGVNITINVFNSTGQSQSGFPQNKTSNVNGMISASWTAALYDTSTDNITIVAWEGNDHFVNASYEFTITLAATLSTDKTLYGPNRNVSVTGTHYTKDGLVNLTLRYLTNGETGPGFPKTLSADSMGDISSWWNTTQYCDGTYRFESIDNVNPDVYNAQTSFELSHSVNAFANADFSTNTVANWQWLGNRYGSVNQCGESAGHANFNINGITVLNSSNTTFFLGSWKMGDSLPVGGGGSEEAIVTTGGSDDYAGMMMSTPVLIPDNALNISFWAYAYYLSPETNACTNTRYIGTLSSASNADRAESIAFGVWVDPNKDTSGNTNIADDYLIYEVFNSTFNEVSDQFYIPEATHTVDVIGHRGENMYVTGVIIGTGNADDALIQIDEVKFILNDSDCIVFDSTPPSISAIKPVANSQYSLNDIVNLTINVNDVHAITSVSIVLDSPNGSSLVRSMTDKESDGKYNFTFAGTQTIHRYNVSFSAVDEYDNTNNEESTWFIVNDNTPPVWSGNATGPITHSIYSPSASYQFNVTWQDNYELADVVIEDVFSGILTNSSVITHNGDEYYYDVANLAAGTYFWRMYANDTSGNINKSDRWVYVVDRESSQVSLELDGVQNNITIEVGTTVNITAMRNAGEGNVFLYLDTVLINQGLTTVTNLTAMTTLGTFNITALYPETENYTRSMQTYFITVEDTISPSVIITKPVNKSVYQNSTVVRIAADVTDNYAVDYVTAIINRDGGQNIFNLSYNTSAGEFDKVFASTSSPGRYNVTVTAYDGSGNSNTTHSYFDVLETLSLETSQESYVINDTAVITGTGFMFNANVTIDIYNSTGQTVAGLPINVSTNSIGSFVYSWNVSQENALGVYMINASDTLNSTRVINHSFKIVSAVIQSISSVYEQGEFLEFFGYNWLPGENVTVNVTNSLGALIWGPVNYTANMSGEINGTTQILYGVLPGTYYINAVSFDTPTKKNTDSFTVLARPVAISVDYPWYWVFEQAQLVGTGFSPSQEVTISIKNTAETPLPGYPVNETSNSSGGFSRSIDNSGAVLDNYTIVASDWLYPNLNDTVTIQIVEPRASLDKQLYSNGETITLSGRFWARSEPVTIVVRNQTGAIIAGYPVNETTSSTGVLSHQLIADSGTLSKHNYTISAVLFSNSSLSKLLNYTVLRAAFSSIPQTVYDQQESINVTGGFFTENGDVLVEFLNARTGASDYYYPQTISANATGEFLYSYDTQDICKGDYVIRMTDLTNPNELTSNVSFSVEFYDPFSSLETADQRVLQGSYNATGGTVASTATDNGVWQYVSGIDSGTTATYINYTYDISALATIPSLITNLEFALQYCYSGDQASLRCNTGANPHEGTANGYQKVEVYNFTSGTWLWLENLTVDGLTDNEKNLAFNISSGFTDVVHNNMIYVRYLFNFTRTLYSDDIFLIDYQSINVTYDDIVSRPCTSFTNNSLNISIVDSSGYSVSSSTVTIINETNDVVDSSIGRYFRYVPDASYTVQLDMPSAKGGVGLLLRDLVFTADTTLRTQMVDDYLGEKPIFVTDMTPVFHLADDSLSYSNAQLSLPMNGLNITTIFHCAAWDYGAANCTAWEENVSSDYNAVKNSTHISFNVTRFDAYGGGPGDTLPNLTQIRLYNVTGLADPRVGGTLMNSGLNTSFNVTGRSSYRVEFDIRNDARKWTIAASDIASHIGLEASWSVDTSQIWYNIAGVNYTGGTFSSGSLAWDLSLGGVLNAGQTGTWYYIVNTTTDPVSMYALDFLVNDTSTNSGSTDRSEYLLVFAKELVVNSSSIDILSTEFIEGHNITLNISVFNIGIYESGSFTFQAWDNSTDTLIYQTTMSILPDSLEWVVFNWTAQTGSHTLQFRADIPIATDGVVTEHFEGNNLWNTTIIISSWHVLVGNVTQITQLSGATSLFHRWNNKTPEGFIYASDSDATVAWTKLQALGRTKANTSATNDFADADILLGTSGYPDSIQTLFAQDASTPLQTTIRTLEGRIISNIPYVNTTNSSHFITAVVWDTSVDTNGEFDSSEAENLIFLTQINQSKRGMYGRYDYELRIPSSLENTQGASATTYLYLEIT